jgi:hypothetical protein
VVGKGEVDGRLQRLIERNKRGKKQ